eukprot:scaffold76816_cov36-Phaeocystis_antarctica.AAC.1
MSPHRLRSNLGGGFPAPGAAAPSGSPRGAAALGAAGAQRLLTPRGATLGGRSGEPPQWARWVSSHWRE